MEDAGLHSISLASVAGGGAVFSALLAALAWMAVGREPGNQSAISRAAYLSALFLFVSVAAYWARAQV